MKKLLRTVTTTVLLSSMLAVTSCSSSSQDAASTETASETAATSETVEQPTKTTKLIVGATSMPHAEILNLIKDDLLAEGVEIEVKEFSDYVLLNPSTVDGSLDANFFQHTPYLDEFNATSDKKLVAVGPIHIEPIGLYSSTIKSLDELKDGDKIAIPNDPSNEQRALLLLEDNGVIKVKDRNSSNITPIDIVENPLNLEFTELDAALLSSTMSDFTAAVINTNFAVQAGLNPANDSIIIEDGATSPYANVLVVLEGNENNEAIQALYKAMTSDKVKQFIEENYKGDILSAF